MRLFLLSLLFLPLACGCSQEAENVFQGYIEGEFVDCGPAIGGRLLDVKVKKGQLVDVGDLLYLLEYSETKHELARASERLKKAQSELADLRKGKRPAEIAVLEQQLAQAKASAWHARQQYGRDKAIIKSKGVSQADLEKSQTEHERGEARVQELLRQLEVARLPARDDIIAAREADVRGAEAARDLAEWRFEQTKLDSPRAGLVTDVIYRVGEWVYAGAPIVRLLPPENIKARFFVPEKYLSKISMGQRVQVHIDGKDEALDWFVDYISPQAEYTPPVIYSNETRSKLIFMIEARPENFKDEPHPGQPVKVVLP